MSFPVYCNFCFAYMTHQDGWLLSSIRAICKTFALASLGLLLTSCISIHWTTEEEANRQAELLNRIVSNEEVGWDATEVLKNLRSMRIALEASPRRRHAHILSGQRRQADCADENGTLKTHLRAHTRSNLPCG